MHKNIKSSFSHYSQLNLTSSGKIHPRMYLVIFLHRIEDFSTMRVHPTPHAKGKYSWLIKTINKVSGANLFYYYAQPMIYAA